MPEYQINAGRGQYQLARLLLAPNQVTYKPDNAVNAAQEAQRLFQQALKTRPGSERDLLLLLEDEVLLTLALVAAGRIEDAAAVAEHLPSSLPADPAVYCRAAALLVDCAATASKSAATQPLAPSLLSRAVGALRAGVTAKAIRSSKSLELPDLRPLYERDDFKKLKAAPGSTPCHRVIASRSVTFDSSPRSAGRTQGTGAV